LRETLNLESVAIRSKQISTVPHNVCTTHLYTERKSLWNFSL